MPHADQIQAFARYLVAALFPALEAAMLSGLYHRTVIAQAAALAGPAWRREHGSDLADAALAVLHNVSAAAIMCEDVRDAWIEAAPVMAIPARTPVEAIAPAPPRVGIRARLQAVAALFRVLD